MQYKAEKGLIERLKIKDFDAILMSVDKVEKQKDPLGTVDYINTLAEGLSVPVS